MHPYRPSELREFLKEVGAAPQKSLSQNFLIDQNIVEKICKVTPIKKGDAVIEIGPGPGVLTWALRSRCDHLTVIELDRCFAQEIVRFSPDLCLHQDALEIDYHSLVERIRSQMRDKGATASIHLVSNLPYHLSSPLLEKLLPLYGLIDHCTLMMQEEFAQRLLCHEAKKRDYGRLGIFCYHYAKVIESFPVRKNSFYPAPKVASRVVCLKLQQPPLDADELQSFLVWIKVIFGMRRKMLRVSLWHWLILFLKEKQDAKSEEERKTLEEGLLKLLHPFETRRPEEVEIPDLQKIHEALYKRLDQDLNRSKT